MKIILTLLVIAALAFAAYTLFGKGLVSVVDESREVYETQEECEGKTGKSCQPLLCDINCDPNFKKGWVPRNSSL